MKLAARIAVPATALLAAAFLAPPAAPGQPAGPATVTAGPATVTRPVAAPAATTPSYKADLKVTSVPAHGKVSSIQPYPIVTYFQNLGPSNTLTGDVTEDFVA